MDRRRFLRMLPAASATAALLTKAAQQSARRAAETFETIVDREGWWGVPGATWQLVTHEFGQTWMRVR